MTAEKGDYRKPDGLVVDLFAGPGGWDEGVLPLGLRPVGFEWDKAACLTGVAAGHTRVQADVARVATAPMVGKVRGVIASPPCQAWSMAGNRKGELDRQHCHDLAERMAAGDDSTDWCEWEDPRSSLVCQPIRFVRDIRPEWVALEQVPPVIGLWEHFALIFRRWGYSVWTGVLNAADYGVPQTRQRAILTASLTRTMSGPEPTHAQGGAPTDLFGTELLPWVSMAEALGWGATARPMVTVTSSDPNGAHGGRDAIEREKEAGGGALAPSRTGCTGVQA